MEITILSLREKNLCKYLHMVICRWNVDGEFDDVKSYVGFTLDWEAISSSRWWNWWIWGKGPVSSSLLPVPFVGTGRNLWSRSHSFIHLINLRHQAALNTTDYCVGGVHLRADHDIPKMSIKAIIEPWNTLLVTEGTHNFQFTIAQRWEQGVDF